MAGGTGVIARLGEAIGAVFRRIVPDPFVLAVLLTLLTAALAVGFGYPAAEGERPGFVDRVVLTLDSWGGIAGPGAWSLLAFSMQMCLVLTTGHALASSPPVRRLLERAADIPRSTRSAAGMIAFAACSAALINWGLGLIVGAILARDAARSLERRGIAHSRGLLAAAGYTGLMVWHGGLSGSSPLSVTTVENAARSLPAEVLAGVAPASGPWIPLSQTIGSTMNLVITGGLLVIVPLVMWAMGSGRSTEGAKVPATHAHEPRHAKDDVSDGEVGRESGVVAWLERSPIVVWLLAVAITGALARYVSTKGLGTIGLNEINFAMLAAGLILHGSARAYVDAVDEAARGCGGIILQFPLYAGIMAMMQASGLVAIVTEGMIGLSNARTLPLMDFIAASITNLFVPSGGGQWAVQGPIAIRAGHEAGVPLGKMVMSVAYGDQLTNMLQPFWALPLLAITGARAREIVGYTAIAMLVGGAWIGLGLLLF